MNLLRLWFRRRRLGYRACAAPLCPHKRTERGLRLSHWCDDHTDAIFAGGPLDKDGAAVRRLGARRWALRAEVDAELERCHAPVLEAILEQGPLERKINRRCWDTGAVKLSERVDELLELGIGS